MLKRLRSLHWRVTGPWRPLLHLQKRCCECVLRREGPPDANRFLDRLLCPARLRRATGQPVWRHSRLSRDSTFAIWGAGGAPPSIEASVAI